MKRFLSLIAVFLACAALQPAAQGQAGRQVSAPPIFDVVETSIDDLQRAMQTGTVTSRQLVDLYLARIQAYDEQGPALNAIAAINPKARQEAEALDLERTMRGPRGPLHGIPVLVKDNYETIDMPTTGGSIALAGFHPMRDATLVRKLKEAGAIVIGKTNMHELASGVVTVGSGFGQTRNPYDLDRTPGGSSGGTGAAVAANFAAAGLGTDTCGSIRIPSAFNNLVGLRGTRGLSSRTGIIPLSLTQDIGGPLARTITDLSLLLDATVGPDPADSSTRDAAAHIPQSYRSSLRADALKGARFGVVRSLLGAAPEDREVATVVDRAVDALKQAGAEVTDAVIPGLDELLRDSSMINADFKFDFADYLATTENPPVRSLAEIVDRGLVHSSLEAGFRMRTLVEKRDTEEARRAMIKREALRNAIESVLEEHRLVALVYPTVRRKPARIGDGQGGSNCQLSAHSGLPALSIPAGFTDDGLPVGIDLLGSAFSESDLLGVGYGAEQTLKLRRNPFSTPTLVNDHAPAATTTTLRFSVPATPTARRFEGLLTTTYDQTTSMLRYSFQVDQGDFKDVVAVWIHGGTVEKPAAARDLLISVGQPLAGVVRLSAVDRRDLASGNLVGRLFVRDGRPPVTIALTLTR